MPDEEKTGAAARPFNACQAPMLEGKRCGRAIHPAPEGADRKSKCLMHSKDPAKSVAEFQAEFERILAWAEQTGTVADFTGFVFPLSGYSGRTFAPKCHFGRATFTRDAHFTVAKFAQHADFRGATFTECADFRGAKFTQEARFYGAGLIENADFSGATFARDADFREATFAQDTDFSGAAFAQAALFLGARFTHAANFSGARFAQGAHFLGATFAHAADFSRAMFPQDADFSKATFIQAADFSGAAFIHAADFRWATAHGPMRFRETRFRQDSSGDPGLDFSDVQTRHPEEVEFYSTDLGQALFYNTDVSEMDFTLVEWRGRGRSMGRYRQRLRIFRWRRWLAVRGRTAWIERWGLLARLAWQRTNRLCLFEEDASFEEAEALRPQAGSPDERNYGLIAETYQQLRRNYDAKGDYWTAGHWHLARWR